MKLPHIVLAAVIAIFVIAMFRDTPVPAADTDEVVEIEYWEKWTSFEGEAMKSTIDLFNKKGVRNKKGQRIVCKYLQMTQVDRKLMLSVAGGNPPDLCGFWYYNFSSYVDMDVMTPLDDLIKRDNFDTGKFEPIFWNGCVYHGKTWAIPTTPTTTALHWNKDLFKAAGLDPERPPRTLKEIEEFNEKLTKRDASGRVTQMGFLPPEPGWYHFSWGYFFGGKLTNGPDKITTSDPKNVEAFEWVLKFSGDTRAEKEMRLSFKQGFGSFDSPQNAFLSGKVAMVYQGVWMANFIRFHNPKMQWGAAPMPSNWNEPGEPVTVADQDVLLIPRGSKHPEEAWTVMKFIASNEGMENLCLLQGKCTPFKENTPGWIEHHPHPHLQVFIDMAKSKNAIMSPQVPVWEEYRAEMRDAFEAVWVGDLTPKQALTAVENRLQSKMDKILAVRRKREAQDAERAK